MEKLTICRKWNNPQIKITVTSEKISMEMSLQDFLLALADEVAEPLVEDIAANAGNPSLWFTKEAVVKNLVSAIESQTAHKHFTAAADRVIEVVKRESSKAM